MSRRNAVSRAAFATTTKSGNTGRKGRNNDSKKLPRSSCDEVMKRKELDGVLLLLFWGAWMGVGGWVGGGGANL